jgi:hypothetical protein
VFGVVFLAIQVFIFSINLQADDKSFYFWFCNHIPILFSLAFFTKQYQLVKALISVGLLPQLIWILDLTLYGIFDITLFGFTNYFFTLESTLKMFSTLLIHVFSTLLALLFTYKIPVESKSLKLSFLYLIILSIVTFLFTKSSSNVNCLHQICGIESLTPPLFPFLWPIITFLIMVIPAFYLQKLLSKLSRKLK